MAGTVKESSAEKDVFSLLRKTDSVGADMTCYGRLFQMRAVATGKARLPTACGRQSATVMRRNVDNVYPRGPPAG